MEYMLKIICLFIATGINIYADKRIVYLKNSENIVSPEIKGYLYLSLQLKFRLKNDIFGKSNFKNPESVVRVCISAITETKQKILLCDTTNSIQSKVISGKHNQEIRDYNRLAFPIENEYHVIQVLVEKNAKDSYQPIASFSTDLNFLRFHNDSHDIIITPLNPLLDVEVTATLSLHCSPHFFGPFCKFSCKPPSERQVCDHVTGELKCVAGWTGKDCSENVFLTRSQASQFIRRFKRANQIFEELLPGNIERECVEESCSREEAREAFEDDQATENFWRAYTDPNQCDPNPCISANTDRCEDLLGDYTCHCRDGYTGKNCDIEENLCRSDPCKNGGTCQAQSSSAYSCLCAPGYRGRTCRINIDDCVGVNCSHHGYCVDGVNSFSCKCDDGFKGSRCEQDINECKNNPCQNGGNCTDHVAFYTCQCLPGFKGKRCQNKINPCKKNPCLNGGSCDLTADYDFNCSCADGFVGRRCQHSSQSVCASMPCSNGGTCYEIRNNITDELNPSYPDIQQEFGCACPVEFTGATCEIIMNPCKLGGEICPFNSTCVPLHDEYICVCPEGFTGDMCQHHGNDNEALDELRCRSNPCLNDARCVSFQNTTTCICRPGYRGSQCENEAEHCSSFPCTNNGECVEISNGFFCSCPQGYRGKYCEEDIDECLLLENICQNRATCTNTEGSFRCNCGPYHTGRFCEHPFDPCDSDPCQNGGSCEHESLQYMCDCLQGYGGRHCQVIIDPCSDITNPCLNGATCSANPDISYEAICACAKGYYGKRCEKGVDNCAVMTNVTHVVNGSEFHQYEGRKDCGEHGECVSNPFNFTCNCLPGYEGERCETAYEYPVVNCTSQDCHCPPALMEEVSFHSLNRSQLQCRYRDYEVGVCEAVTCLTSVCPHHLDVHECSWISECLTEYKNGKSFEKDCNSSSTCPVLEIVLDRSKLEDDTTVEHFCDDMRNLPSYQNFRDAALIHCSLLSVNDINSSVAVAIDSVTSKSKAILLASDIFQYLEEVISTKKKDKNLDPSLAALVKVRYASSTSHPLNPSDKTTTLTPLHSAVDEADFTHYYVIIAILVVSVIACIVFLGYLFMRQRKKRDLLVSYVANPNAPEMQDNSSEQEAQNEARTLQISADAVTFQNRPEMPINGFDNPSYIGIKTTHDGSRSSVHSNQYVSFPYATVESSSLSRSDSEEKTTVEERTVDYGVVQKPTSRKREPRCNQYECMTNFPMASSFTKSSADSAYEFAADADQPFPELAEKKEDASVAELPANSDPFNDYEEIPTKRSAAISGSQYETVNLFTVPIYSNLQSCSMMEADQLKLVNDSPYNFATEIPSVGVPSFSPPRRSTAIKKSIESADDSTYINPLPISGENDGVTMNTRNAAESNQSEIEGAGKKSSFGDEKRDFIPSDKNLELPLVSSVSSEF